MPQYAQRYNTISIFSKKLIDILIEIMQTSNIKSESRFTHKEIKHKIQINHN